MLCDNLKKRKKVVDLLNCKLLIEESTNNFYRDDEFYLHGSIRTTAEPRPNAYIPQNSGVGQLPIPKPYGEHSPFKPQEPGSQLRHYRKPVIKPIEI